MEFGNDFVRQAQSLGFGFAYPQCKMTIPPSHMYTLDSRISDPFEISDTYLPH